AGGGVASGPLLFIYVDPSTARAMAVVCAELGGHSGRRPRLCPLRSPAERRHSGEILRCAGARRCRDPSCLDGRKEAISGGTPPPTEDPAGGRSGLSGG